MRYHHLPSAFVGSFLDPTKMIRDFKRIIRSLGNPAIWKPHCRFALLFAVPRVSRLHVPMYNANGMTVPILHMDVSENSGTPKTSQNDIFSRKKHGCWVPHGTTILGNPHMFMRNKTPDVAPYYDFALEWSISSRDFCRG